ncbi:MAG: DUF58 domain-containing protein [Gemmatimonadota bacterium]
MSEETHGRLDLVSPRELARIANLELVARGVVEGFLLGLHRSPYRGFSVEFAENRLYNPGDDTRFVDWKVYARSDRLYIKQYEEETNLRAHIVVDISRSMAWTSDPGRFVTKLDYSRMLAASLALLLLRQGDAAGLLTFDDRPRDRVEPRAALGQWRRLLNDLAAAHPGGRTDAGAVLTSLARRLRRRGLVVLVSDLLVDPASTRHALKLLRHQGHEALIFHVMDRAEMELPAAGEATFYDPETGEELGTNSATLRRDYREAVSEAIERWRRESLGMGVDYALLTTDRPLGVALHRYLRGRIRRQR